MYTLTSLIFVLTAISAGTQAAAIPGLHKRSSITTACQHFQMFSDDRTFVCIPNPGQGGGPVATIDLNNCIGNNNGILFARQEGFVSTCNPPVLLGTTLNAQCKAANGQFVGSSVNLDEILNFQNGQLAC